MDCPQIRDAFLNGVAPAEEQVKPHLAGCSQCRELFEQGAELGRNLAAQTRVVLPAAADDFFAEIEGKLARETGPRAWLRSRPSLLRLSFVLLPLLDLVPDPVLPGGERVAEIRLGADAASGARPFAPPLAIP